MAIPSDPCKRCGGDPAACGCSVNSLGVEMGDPMDYCQVERDAGDDDFLRIVIGTGIVEARILLDPDEARSLADAILEMLDQMTT